MEQKTFMEVSCIYNIHTGERVFYTCYFWRFVNHFFSDKVKKLEVYLSLCESSLHFQRGDDQVNTVYKK